MQITLEWLGCATFRLTVDELVVFLDAYMDRVSTAPPVGLSASQVDRADFILVGHSHFDHLAGAEVIAATTGARIIASNESCRVMRDCSVPEDQLLPSQGGEHHRLSSDVSVRVFPSLHSCIWATNSLHQTSFGIEVTGDLGLLEDERAARQATDNPFGSAFREHPEWAREVLEHIQSSTGSTRDGGALVYLIETPKGSIFYQDTSGCWSRLLSGVRADVAILAAAARPNLDGEPYQGKIEDFIAAEVRNLRAQTVVLGHHDNWMGYPGFQEVDVSPLIRALPQGVEVREMNYGNPLALLGDQAPQTS
jgi:L-ascorbate metabolism protein UlaG (beta-lactamase superfamily)